jgi:hypothetical protein
VADDAEVREGKVYIYGVLNVLVTNGVPDTTPRIAVVSQWQGTPRSDTEYTVRINGPHGFSRSFPARAPLGPTGRGHSLPIIVNFVFPAFDEYRVEIVLGKTVEAWETITVQQESGS